MDARSSGALQVLQATADQAAPQPPAAPVSGKVDMEHPRIGAEVGRAAELSPEPGPGRADQESPGPGVREQAPPPGAGRDPGQEPGPESPAEPLPVSGTEDVPGQGAIRRLRHEDVAGFEVEEGAGEEVGQQLPVPEKDRPRFSQEGGVHGQVPDRAAVAGSVRPDFDGPVFHAHLLLW